MFSYTKPASERKNKHKTASKPCFHGISDTQEKTASPVIQPKWVRPTKKNYSLGSLNMDFNYLVYDKKIEGILWGKGKTGTPDQDNYFYLVLDNPFKRFADDLRNGAAFKTDPDYRTFRSKEFQFFSAAELQTQFGSYITNTANSEKKSAYTKIQAGITTVTGDTVIDESTSCGFFGDYRSEFKIHSPVGPYKHMLKEKTAERETVFSKLTKPAVGAPSLAPKIDAKIISLRTADWKLRHYTKTAVGSSKPSFRHLSSNSRLEVKGITNGNTTDFDRNTLRNTSFVFFVPVLAGKTHGIMTGPFAFLSSCTHYCEYDFAKIPNMWLTKDMIKADEADFSSLLFQGSGQAVKEQMLNCIRNELIKKYTADSHVNIDKEATLILEELTSLEVKVPMKMGIEHWVHV